MVYSCLFYDHSLCLSRGLSSPPVEGWHEVPGWSFYLSPAGQWIPACAGMTVVCGWESIFYVYRATMSISNFLVPIPACAGCDKDVVRRRHAVLSFPFLNDITVSLCHLLTLSLLSALCALLSNKKTRWGAFFTGLLKCGPCFYPIHVVLLFRVCRRGFYRSRCPITPLTCHDY